MQILAVDVGTGTQDILLFDSGWQLENCPSMVMPSPTALVANEIRAATARRQDVLLTGFTMGGGPSGWAARDHLKAGLRVYATSEAARTFDDDLEAVQRMGVTLVSDDEAARLQSVASVYTRDLDFASVGSALELFGVPLKPEVLAVAVFDHGAAPPGFSDRVFRFNYIAHRVRQQNRLTAFAYLGPAIPDELTRFRAVAENAARVCPSAPLVVMDTGPAAMLGSLEDPSVSSHRSVMLVNVGNMHTLAFHLVDRRIVGLFEHHTGMLTRDKLDAYLSKLADGTISHREVFEDSGHGALVVEKGSEEPSLVAVTGPRQGLLRGSAWDPYFAVPHGNMMLAGCYGLLRAVATKLPTARPEIERSLAT